MKHRQKGFNKFSIARIAVLILMAISGYAFTVQITEINHNKTLPTFQHINNLQGLDYRSFSFQNSSKITLNNLPVLVADTPPVNNLKNSLRDQISSSCLEIHLLFQYQV